MASARRNHIIVSTKPPVGGLNVRDAINSMPSGDALNLVNWIPTQYGVRCRKGYVNWVTGLGGSVRTVLQFNPDRAEVLGYKLFAATDAGIYDVTLSTAAPGAPIFALSNAVGQGNMTAISYANIAGSFLLACIHNGGYLIYNGTTWTAPIAGVAVGQINGVDPNNLVFISAWKRRLWFVEKGTTKVWYSATDQITGVFTSLDVGPFFSVGGQIAFISSWTIDAGEGIDDFLVIVGENGDVLIYKGTDPAGINTFSLVGRWNVGHVPPGRRGFVQMGGDLLILSDMGIQPLSYITRGGQSLLRSASVDYLAKIQPRMMDLVSSLGDLSGWSMTISAREGLLLVNIPVAPDSINKQYALYLNTNTWTQMQDMPCTGAFCLSRSELFVGTADGRVYKAFTGYFDNVPVNQIIGNGVNGVIQPAYSYFQRPGMNKQFTMIRPTFLAAAAPAISCDISVDFREKVISPPVQLPSVGGSLWDTALWDRAAWEGALVIYDDWISVGGIGYTGSMNLVTTCVGDTFLASIDYMMEPGGTF